MDTTVEQIELSIEQAQASVELGKALERLPGRLVIFAIEAGTLEPGAALSPQVTVAADEVVQNIEAEIASFMSA